MSPTEIISAGGVVAAPAGTVFGLFADPFNATAVEKIFALKGREHAKTLLLNACDVKALSAIAVLSEAEEKILISYDITLILSAKPGNKLAPGIVRGGEIGVRIPREPALRELLAAHPILTSTSANQAGAAPAMTAREAAAIFPTLAVIEEIVPQTGTPSTIAKIINGKVEILRQGSVDANKIEFILDFESNK
ncbi:MAG: L-threonylcarbamoyladenylate synthase [Alphaproteobacteria bacterium]|nr:L-threonylcarbamoyladenylate synthase [Alphaproteobacteria bacterium]